jgi:hypothetical protein
VLLLFPILIKLLVIIMIRLIAIITVKGVIKDTPSTSFLPGVMAVSSIVTAIGAVKSAVAGLFPLHLGKRA